MDATTIRPYEPADLPVVVALAEQLGYAVAEKEALGHMSAIEQDPSQVDMVAADTRGKAMGWVHFFLTRRVFISPQADLGGLDVDEAVRGRSIGEMLMRSAEDWAKTKGSNQFIVRSNVVREGEHRFYVRLGYEAFKRQVVLRKEL